MRYRSIVGEVFSVNIYFLRRGMTKQDLNRSGKVTETRERFTMLVKVGRSADRHCLRRDVGIGSRSEKELDY